MHDGAGEATDRLAERSLRRGGAPVPISLICLHQAGAPPDRLLAATRIGAALNIPPEQVMLREGWISERDYYCALARWRAGSGCRSLRSRSQLEGARTTPKALSRA
jgi:hypothetical protein